MRNRGSAGLQQNCIQEKIDEKVYVDCALENGKALLEWQIDRQEAAHICMKDTGGDVVLECWKAWDEEEPLQSVLLKPNLWSGIANPYLYQLEISFWDRHGNFVDSFNCYFPLRSIEPGQFSPGSISNTLSGNEKYVRLNGEMVPLKTVRYHVPQEQVMRERRRLILEDMRRFLDLGVNSVFVEEKDRSYSFLQLCNRIGLLVVSEEYLGQTDWSIPTFRSAEKALFTASNRPTEYYYLYKARWCSTPFVHIWPESLKRQNDGNYTVTCYSNCKKVALYSEGKLFEFQQGQGIFTFQDVPTKGPCVVLSAEGDGCSTALTVHKTFTKISPNGDN